MSGELAAGVGVVVRVTAGIGGVLGGVREVRDREKSAWAIVRTADLLLAIVGAGPCCKGGESVIWPDLRRK